jgi:hypothetical protein
VSRIIPEHQRDAATAFIVECASKDVKHWCRPKTSVEECSEAAAVVFGVEQPGEHITTWGAIPGAVVLLVLLYVALRSVPNSWPKDRSVRWVP